MPNITINLINIFRDYDNDVIFKFDSSNTIYELKNHIHKTYFKNLPGNMQRLIFVTPQEDVITIKPLNESIKQVLGDYISDINNIYLYEMKGYPDEEWDEAKAIIDAAKSKPNLNLLISLIIFALGFLGGFKFFYKGGRYKRTKK